MTLDPRWKNPQGGTSEQLYLWAQDLIKELRKSDYLTDPIETAIAAADIHSSHVLGTTTNDNAAAGDIGEYLEASVVSGSAIALTTATVQSVAQINLTPGDWDVRAAAYYSAAATTSITRVLASLSSSPTLVFTDPGRFHSRRQAASAAGTSSLALMSSVIAPWRMSLAVGETCYLTVLADFTVSTLSAWGLLSARRVR